MLKYLFTAEYKDGSIYKQNAEDKSVKQPDKKSCYFDVDQDNLVGFVLRGNGHTYGVSLVDGHFEVDGVPFFMHETNNGVGHHIEKLPNGRTVAMPMTKFQLIYWRRNTVALQVHLLKDEQKEIGRDVVYRLGWQCNVKCGRKDCPQFETGHNYQEIMQIE